MSSSEVIRSCCSSSDARMNWGVTKYRVDGSLCMSKRDFPPMAEHPLFLDKGVPLYKRAKEKGEGKDKNSTFGDRDACFVIRFRLSC